MAEAEEFEWKDLLGRLKLDKLYHIFKTNSSKMNLEIYNKLKNFNCSEDFFNYFISKDINLLYDHMNNFILDLSAIIEPNNTNRFNSNSEKYISDFSRIYFLFNMIEKVISSFKKIIPNARSYLEKIYEKYQLDNYLQEKINRDIEEILFFQKNKNVAHDSFDNVKFDNQKENRNDVEKIIVFQNEKNVNPAAMNNLNKNDVNDSDMQLFRKKSQDTEFTFSKKNNEKENNGDLNNKIIKDCNKPSNNIKDYITNINPENFIIRHPKKRRSTYVKKFNSKLDISKVNSVDKTLSTNNLKMWSTNNLKIISNNKMKVNTLKLNNMENHEIYKNLYQSTGHLFIKEESKKYADLLEVIIELYKNDKISLEQKLKLKKMVISKSSNILKIYNLFNHDNEKFLIELKKLIY